MKQGIKILNYRLERKMSQNELSEASGISIRTIQRIEKGDVNPRPFTLRKILSTLNVSVEKFNINSNNNEEYNSENNVLLNRFILANMSILILPFLFIILLIWMWKKYSWAPHYNWICRKILSFQILWGVFTLIAIISNLLLIQMNNVQAAIGLIPTPVLIYFILGLINVLIILNLRYSYRSSIPKFLSFVPNLL